MAHYYRSCPEKRTSWSGNEFEAYCEECSDDERLLPEPELWSATDERGETRWHVTQWYTATEGRPMLHDAVSEAEAHAFWLQVVSQRRDGRSQVMRKLLT